MNLPNKLTVGRIVLVPFFVAALLIDFPLNHLFALIIFSIASLTDMLDGKIARKRNLVTDFGKFADPIADKLLVNCMLIILCYKHMIPLMCCVLMILRDIVVDGCRMLAAQKGIVVSAGLLGKLKTTLQMFSIIIILLNNLPFELWNIPVGEIMIWFTTFISVAGGYSYFMQVKDNIFESI